MEHSHHPGEIRARLAEGPKTSYLSDWVYGGIDGAITTFAIVAGVVGAEMSTRVILILGAANIIADGFSMAASNYSGTKAELDDYRRHRAYEEEQVERIPEAERMEVREIYRSKGFEGQELERIAPEAFLARIRVSDAEVILPPAIIRDGFGNPMQKVDRFFRFSGFVQHPRPGVSDGGHARRPFQGPLQQFLRFVRRIGRSCPSQPG